MDTVFEKLMSSIELEQFKEMRESDWGEDISHSDILYIFIIKHLKKTTVSELSERMAVSKPAITQKINELEKKGIVKKVQARKDKRFFYLSLSHKVKAEISSTRTSKVMDVAKEKHSEDELLVFKNVLTTMTDYILEKE